MLKKSEVIENVIRTSMVRSRGNSRRGERFHPEIEAFFNSIHFLDLLQEGDKVLEMGCGERNTLKKLANVKKINGYGIDIYQKEDDAELEKRRQQDSQWAVITGVPPVHFNRGDFEHMQDLYKDNTFDAVYSYASIVYAYDKLKAVSEAHRVVKVGGIGLLHLQGTPHEGFVPSIDVIIDRFPNEGQLRHLNYPAYVHARSIEATGKFTGHDVLVIKKTSDKPLKLPSLDRTKKGPKHLPASTVCYYAM